MDAKKTLTRLPFTGSLFVIILGIAFVFCRAHDDSVETVLSAYYIEHLLDIEAPIYEDFYSKRLAIEQLGSEKRLAEFRSAQTANEKSLISDLILSDRSFRPYLNEKSHLFFSAKEAENWRNHRQHLNKHLESLSIYRFALIPENFKAFPEFSRLSSYLFIDNSLLNATSNILILFCMFALLEAFVIRKTLWATLFCLSLIHSSLYLCFAGSLNAPLTGANVFAYFMLSLALCNYLRLFFLNRSSLPAYLVFLIGLIWILKAGLDIYFQYINHAQLAGVILAVVLGGILANKDILWRPKSGVPVIVEKTEEIDSDLPAEIRVRYHEALTALTRFNFAYARSTLSQLHSQAPDSRQLLESRYHLEKLHTNEGHFWPLLQARIKQATAEENYSLLLKLFNDMQNYTATDNTNNQLIEPADYLKILLIFLQNHNLDKAEYTFKLLTDNAHQDITKEACLRLIEHCGGKKLLSKQAHYQAIYANL